MAMAMDVIQGVSKEVQSAVGRMLKKSLNDLVRGIRSNKGNESKFINDAIAEIKEELKSTDKDEKANAVQKLTYLQMLGYNMDWASFPIIEVISHPKFSHKRIGYLAACQTFSETTDVMVLATNLIRKDCLSPQMYNGGIAINCLSRICSPDLARDLVPDIVSMLTSAQPYLRKKAVLLMYKIFLKFPDALRPSFNRLKERLDDPDPSVVSAAVNVICELARKNAKNYLSLAPTLFKLMTKSNNNWMLIKIIKLFAVLCPHEERLARKIMEPLCNIINSTNSMSLMFEAIHTCIVGLSSLQNVMKLCVTKLRMFIEHPDQNLKYLGLLALSRIMEVFPRGIAEHRDLILNCLEDEDETIRLRAVELLTGMVDKKNLAVIVDKLKHYLETADGHYRDDLLGKIIYICSQEKYKYITDFEWYIGLLMELTQVKGVKNGSVVSTQIFDVCVRVQIVRPYAVQQMVLLLQDSELLTEDPQAGGMCEALYAAAWVVGEYAELCNEPEKAIDLLTRAEVTGLPAHIQAIFIQNAFKVLAVLATKQPPAPAGTEQSSEGGEAKNDLSPFIALLEERIPLFMSSMYIEVQERACFFDQVLRLYKEKQNSVELLQELRYITEEAFGPVSDGAQGRVKPPEGLDLDAWINEPMPQEESPYMEQPGGYSWNEDATETRSPGFNNTNVGAYGGIGGGGGSTSFDEGLRYPVRYVSEEEIAKQRAQRLREREGNIHYLMDDTSEPNAPVRNLELDPEDAKMLRNLNNPDPTSSPKRGRGAFRGFRGRGARPQRPTNQPVAVIVDEENPEGWTPGTEEKKPDIVSSDPLARIDLTVAPEGDVSLPQRRHRTDMQPTPSPSKPEPAKKPPPTQPPGTAPRGRGQPGGRGRPPVRGVRGGVRGGRGAPPGRAAPSGRGGPPGRGAHPPGRGAPGAGRAAPRGRGAGRGGAPAAAPPVEGAAPQPSTATPTTAPAAAAQSTTPAGPSIDLARARPLARDSNIEVLFDILAHPNKRDRLLGVLHFKNITEDKHLQQIHVQFNVSENFRVAPHPQRQSADPIPVEFELPAKASNTTRVPFAFESLTVPQDLQGTITYKIKDAPEEIKLEFPITFSCSSFILPSSIDPAAFTNLLASVTEARKTTLSVSLEQALAKICSRFHVKVVEQVGDKASAYGRTTHEHHVAFLLKQEPDQPLAVAVRTNSATLSQSLLQELQQCF